MSIEPDTLLPEYRAGLAGPDDEGMTRWQDEARARAVLYADCGEGDARAAFARLRPQARTPHAQPCRLETLPETPRTYVVCDDDRMVNPDRARRVARERLDADISDVALSEA